MVSIFGRPNCKERREKGRRRRRGRGREEEEKPSKKVWIHDLCMDFGKILSKNQLGYGLLGFYLDINLVPLSRVLLGRHPNSRFKGSLVEKP